MGPSVCGVCLYGCVFHHGGGRLHECMFLYVFSMCLCVFICLSGCVHVCASISVYVCVVCDCREDDYFVL